MKVELAAKAGFCFGVNRAVDKVYEQAAHGEQPVYTYGPIIHNESVIEDLSSKGVKVIDDMNAIQSLSKGTIIIRSHGVTRAEQECLQKTGLQVVDATCPFVKKIHEIVKDYAEQGYEIIIVGSEEHPEVQGILGWSVKERTTVLATIEEAKAYDVKENIKLCIVAQTTFNYKKFQEIVEILIKKGYDRYGTLARNIDIVVKNTICSATRERQEAAKELSTKVDAMLVIGGSSSSNTRKLYDICSQNCPDTYFIQTKKDIAQMDFTRFDYVGITAGASTPNNIIEEVQKYVRNEL